MQNSAYHSKIMSLKSPSVNFGLRVEGGNATLYFDGMENGVTLSV
jgi:hypothetical protein